MHDADGDTDGIVMIVTSDADYYDVGDTGDVNDADAMVLVMERYKPQNS